MGRKVGLWLFVAAAGLYLLGGARHIYTADGVIMFRVTRSISEGTLAIRPLAIDGSDFGGRWVESKGGQRSYYAKFGVGLSVAALPSLLLGTLLAPLARESERRLFEYPAFYDTSPANFRESFQAYVATWTSAVLAALTLLAVFLLCRELGYRERTALIVAALGGVATPLWHYSKDFFAEPLGGMGLAFFLYFARRGLRQRQPASWWLCAGLMLGVALAAKIAHAILLLPAALLLLAYARRLVAGAALRGLAAGALGLGLVLAGIALYNHARFGSVLETGYGGEARLWSTPLWTGLLGLLVSPGRGLLLYFPLWILVLLAAGRFYRRGRAELLFALLCLVLLLGLYSRWHMWQGGWCWGPRFLLPALPLLLLPLASLFEPGEARRSERWLVLVVAALGLLVAVNGIIVNYQDYCEWLRQHYAQHAAAFRQRGIGHYYQLMEWSPTFSPLVRHWTFSNKSYFALAEAIRFPGLVLALHGCFCGLLALGAGKLARALRATR